jgi:hypothetical protein
VTAPSLKRVSKRGGVYGRKAVRGKAIFACGDGVECVMQTVIGLGLVRLPDFLWLMCKLQQVF